MAIVSSFVDAGDLHPGVPIYFSGALGTTRRGKSSVCSAALYGTGDF